MKTSLLMLVTVWFVTGCVSTHQPVMTSPTYQALAPLESSLFPSDQAVLSDDAIKQILSSKIELPKAAKLAVMKFPSSNTSASRYYGSYYWRAEEYLKTEQHQLEALNTSLAASKRIAEVTHLPTLMVPKAASIPLLREATVRMQADLLLVFRISSDTYYKHGFFEKDQVKAYSTCEAVLLDVRTGIVPFTRVITREKLRKKSSEDLDQTETMRKAESEASIDALKAVAGDLASFLNSLPSSAN